MTDDEWKKVPYVHELPRDGRVISLTSYFDDAVADWIFMFPVRPGELGRLAGGAPVRAEYFARSPASPTDVYLPLSTLVRQHLSWPDVMHRLDGVESDLHLFCDILEKFELISERASADVHAVYLATSELEFLIRVARSTYDQIQKLVTVLAGTLMKVDDPSRKLMQQLPDSFADVLRADNPRTAQELIDKFKMPEPLAAFYAAETSFFVTLRAFRNKLEHHGVSAPIAIRLDDGLAVDVTHSTWRELAIWENVELKNEKLGPLRLVFAHVVNHMLGVLQRFARMFVTTFGVPPGISKDIVVFLRNPYGHHLARLDTTLASPWDQAR